jgi:hypothetical protein
VIGLLVLGGRAEAGPHDLLPVASMVAVHAVQPAAAPDIDRTPLRDAIRASNRDEDRPRPLVPLYVSFAALQALDLHSTRAALDRGYAEANPVMAPFVRHRGAALAFKVATTGVTIFAVERLWRREHRTAAVITMIAANAGYAFIVSQNYRKAAAR